MSGATVVGRHDDPVTHFVWNARRGLEVQDRQNELPGVREAKQRTAALLDPAERVVDVGLVNVATGAFVVVSDDPDEPSLSVPTWLASWTKRGRLQLNDAALERWDRAITDARHHGGYLATITYLLTHGSKA